jgi:hypothetical protein
MGDGEGVGGMCELLCCGGEADEVEDVEAVVVVVIWAEFGVALDELTMCGLSPLICTVLLELLLLLLLL